MKVKKMMRKISGQDAGARIEDDVAAQDARDGARGAERRHQRIGPDRDLQRQRRDPREQVEDDEAHRPHGVLDVVAEDPQEEHVAAEVQQAGVGEHAGEDRRPRGDAAVRQALVARDGRALLDEVAVLARMGQLVGDRPVVVERGLRERVPGEVDPRLRLQEEVDEDVDHDQRDRDDRRAVGREVVLEREQGPGRLPAPGRSQRTTRLVRRAAAEPARTTSA